jgi:hypothetical protein
VRARSYIRFLQAFAAHLESQLIDRNNEYSLNVVPKARIEPYQKLLHAFGEER